MSDGEGERTDGAKQRQLESPSIDSHESSRAPGRICCRGQTPPCSEKRQTSAVVPVSPPNLLLLRD